MTILVLAETSLVLCVNPHPSSFRTSSMGENYLRISFYYSFLGEGSVVLGNCALVSMSSVLLFTDRSYLIRPSAVCRAHSSHSFQGK